MEEHTEPNKFEYKIVELKEKGFFLTSLKMSELENELNFHGENGWDLTSSVSSDN